MHRDFSNTAFDDMWIIGGQNSAIRFGLQAWAVRFATVVNVVANLCVPPKSWEPTDRMPADALDPTFEPATDPTPEHRAIAVPPDP